jgi:Fe-S-cluster containining protein
VEADEGILSIFSEYDRLLLSLDARFRAVRTKYGNRMECGKGCIDCCTGLFDISIPDALRVAAGYHRLSPSTGNEVTLRAGSLNAELLTAVPELQSPFFLDLIAGDRIDRLAERFDTVRCPLLGEDDGCLVYRHRPLACILEGIPMVDVRDGLFDDWCRLNFTDGLDGGILRDLALDYTGIEATVESVSESLVMAAPSFPGRDATIFIPSVIAAYESFWKSLVAE